MVFETTQSRSVSVAADEAPGLIPAEIAVGGAVLRLRPTGSGGATGHWSASGATGAAYASFRPLGPQTTEMTLTLTAPEGLERVAWPKPRLALMATRLTPVLAWEIGLRAETGTGPFRARRVPAGRITNELM